MWNKLPGLVLILLFSLAACKSDPANENNGAKSPAPEEEATYIGIDDRTIALGKRVGMITPTHSSMGEIIAVYAPNAKEADIPMAEGDSTPGLVLFADSDDEILLGYDEQLSKEKPAFITIERPNSPWKTEEGVALGMDISALEKLNGKPFSFSGFDWDLGGWVTNWNGGQLEGKGLMIRLSGEGYGAELSGDRTLNSNDPAVGKMKNGKVVSMRIAL